MLQQILNAPAPAKLNLFLHVVGRRLDGYHLLQSVFALIDWCDVLHFDKRAMGQISREDLTQTLPEDDLTLRAAKALQSATGCSQGVHIAVAKHIPAQAGLGGGSSDAATCLLALNRLWGLGLTRHELVQIGLKLGADVPFFIHGHNAWVEGIGEQITPITNLSNHDNQTYLVIWPGAGASTPAIFSSPNLKIGTKPVTMQGFAAGSKSIESSKIELILDTGCNDLEQAAKALCPEVGVALDWFAKQGLKARMTGSGSAVFARVDEIQVSKLDAALQQSAVDASEGQGLSNQWVWRFCQGLTEHPLQKGF